MDKRDFIKEDKELYTAATEPELIEVPNMLYLMYDGQGAPEGNPEFQQAMSALYSVAYTIKFMPKHGDQSPWLRGLQGAAARGALVAQRRHAVRQTKPDEWYWTLMPRVPQFVDPVVVDTAIAELTIKKHNDAFRKVRLEQLEEGPVVQITAHRSLRGGAGFNRPDGRLHDGRRLSVRWQAS